MKKVYFPGCRIKARYTLGSEKLKAYMQERWGLEPTGCCKENFGTLEPEDVAVLICNNCSKELHHLGANQNREFVYEMIDGDASFFFPNYAGREMMLQDCCHGYDDHAMGVTVRSLLEKMHTSYEAFPEGVADGTDYAAHARIAGDNAASTEKEIVTHCGICNLAALKAGKKSHLLLDLLFETE